MIVDTCRSQVRKELLTQSLLLMGMRRDYTLPSPDWPLHFAELATICLRL